MMLLARKTSTAETRMGSQSEPRLTMGPPWRRVVGKGLAKLPPERSARTVRCDKSMLRLRQRMRAE